MFTCGSGQTHSHHHIQQAAASASYNCAIERGREEKVKRGRERREGKRLWAWQVRGKRTREREDKTFFFLNVLSLLAQWESYSSSFLISHLKHLTKKKSHLNLKSKKKEQHFSPGIQSLSVFSSLLIVTFLLFPWWKESERFQSSVSNSWQLFVSKTPVLDDSFATKQQQS